MIVHRHASFPIDIGESGCGDLLFRCAEVAAEFAVLRKAFQSVSPDPDAVVDKNIRLKTSYIIIKIPPLVGGPCLFPFAVEPEDSDFTVICKKLF